MERARIAVVLSAALAMAVVADDAWSGRGRSGGGGGGHHSFSGRGISHAPSSHAPSSHFHSHAAPAFGHHPHFRRPLIVGTTLFIGPPLAYYYPPPVYIEKQYWFYCESAGAYYPYVKECPSGWQRVLPTPEESTPLG
jgi:hypothetical protein